MARSQVGILEPGKEAAPNLIKVTNREESWLTSQECLANSKYWTQDSFLVDRGMNPPLGMLRPPRAFVAWGSFKTYRIQAMLVCLQFPISDFRKFLDFPTGLLAAPVWPLPDVQKEFVRSFGPIRRRPLGGVPGWLHESRICEAKKCLYLSQSIQLENGNRITPFKCVFRRFYFDGVAVGKYEIGFRIKADVFKSEKLKQALQDILNLPAKIGNHKRCVPLGEAGKLLSEYYLDCTTSTSFEKNKLQKWWVNHGSPILLVESKTKDVYEQQLAFNDLEAVYKYKHQLGLYHLWLFFERQKINIWFLRIFKQKDDPIARMNYVENRIFRQYLLRYHAEQECLLKVLGAYGKNIISCSLNADAYDVFQRYVRNTANRLEKSKTKITSRYGEDIAELVKEAWDFAEPGERDALLCRLKLIRPQVYKKASKLVEEFRKPKTIAYINKVHIGELIMGDMIKQSAFGDGNVLNVVKDSGKQKTSVNLGNDLKTDNVLKKQVDELDKLVKQLVAEVDIEQAEKIKTYHDHFREQCMAKKPLKDLMTVSAEGLIEAAKVCAKLAKPITACVHELSTLFI